MPKIYIIAGEPSGDYIGSCIMSSIKQVMLRKTSQNTFSEIEFCGIGGPLMQPQGLSSLFNIDQLSVMGFVEILPQIFKLKKLIEQTVESITETSPNLLVTIDSPGFTYRVAKKVRELHPNLKMIHIVAPSVWAYKPNRALKYAKIYDHLLALLPFEPPYFEKLGLDTTCVGHFIFEQDYFHDKNLLRKEFNIGDYTKILCVTPGSRKGEIARHMPVFAKALQIIKATYPDLKVFFVLNNNKYEALIQKHLENVDLDYSFSGKRLKIFALADVALAKSGTNSLEIAASSTPMVVAYKLNPLSFAFLKLFLKVKYASLINIIGKREIIPEFIQSNCTPEKIGKAIIELFESSDERSTQISLSKNVLESMGFGSSVKPSIKAAEIIIKSLK